MVQKSHNDMVTRLLLSTLVRMYACVSSYVSYSKDVEAALDGTAVPPATLVVPKVERHLFHTSIQSQQGLLAPCDVFESDPGVR